MFAITAPQLLQITPRCRAPIAVAANLNVAMGHYRIATDIDFVRAFIAQLAVESAEFNATVENLNYGAVGLMNTWPTRFKTLDVAKFYERQPEKIANYVYANRLGNGDEASGDGWRHRGMGWIQATGKTNQEALLGELGLPLNRPELLQEFRWAAMSAGAYWARKPQLSILADDLPNDDDARDFFSISRLVNGGTIGLKERQAYWAKAKQVLK